MNKKELLTQEIKLKGKNRFNKSFIGFFIFIAISTVIMKFVDVILLDLGYKNGGFNLNFWKDPEFISEAFDKGNLSMQKQIERHPNLFWPMTQFTWITTFLIIVLMSLRFFKFSQGTLPSWIRWIMTQRTLSLLAMYDFIVASVFWGGMFKGFANAFHKELYWLEFITTVFVHAVIPFMFIAYSFIFLTKDKKASILKEGFVVKGMVYPLIYIGYYILVAVTWTDPYPITDLHNDFVGNLWKLPMVLFGIYTLLGFMILLHNASLLRFNKSYDPKNDHDILMRKANKIEKIYKRAIRKRRR